VRKTEEGSPKTEVGSRKSEDGRWKTGDGRLLCRRLSSPQYIASTSFKKRHICQKDGIEERVGRGER